METAPETAKNKPRALRLLRRSMSNRIDKTIVNTGTLKAERNKKMKGRKKSLLLLFELMVEGKHGYSTLAEVFP